MFPDPFYCWVALENPEALFFTTLIAPRALLAKAWVILPEFQPFKNEPSHGQRT
jgi:hypothetical protein